MKKVLLLAVLFVAVLGKASTPAQTAPVAPPLAACTFTHPEGAPTMMVPRIQKSYGMLTLNSAGDPILIHPANNTVAVPTSVTTTPCVTGEKSLVYLLTVSVAQQLNTGTK
jgi:hypothetical protein